MPHNSGSFYMGVVILKKIQASMGAFIYIKNVLIRAFSKVSIENLFLKIFFRALFLQRERN